MHLVFLGAIFTSIAQSLGNEQHICSYTSPSIDEVMTGVDVGSSHVIRKRSSVQNLRILPYFDNSFDQLIDAVIIKREIIMVAIRYWENALKVRLGSSNIKLNRHCNSARVGYTNKNNQFIYYCGDGCSNETTCGPITVPPEHLNVCHEIVDNVTQDTGEAGPGVSNADFILYIASQATSKCSGQGVLAYAAHCQLEGQLDRPVAGYINFCPNRLSHKFGNMAQSLFTAKHEILHALGFAMSLYAFYRDPDGNPLTPRSNTTGKPDLGPVGQGISVYQWSDSVIKNVTRTWKSVEGIYERNVSIFILPKVLQEARSHFSCPTLDGMEMEDQGKLGVSVTHWEKRLLENELMTATFTQEDSISRLTLALMEDTGWYFADYSKADNLKWGKGLGCDFAMKSCYEYIEKRRKRGESIEPYCDSVHESDYKFRVYCTVDRAAYGYCNLVRFNKPLPPTYRYFTSLAGVPPSALSYYGSQIFLADYCPYVQSFNWQESDQTVTRTTHCAERRNQKYGTEDLLFETYGAETSCFLQTGAWSMHSCGKKYTPNVMGAGCYQYSCSSTAGLIIRVNGRSHQCLKTGQLVNITSATYSQLYRGTLICPNCLDICSPHQCPANPSLLALPPVLSIQEEPCCALSIQEPITAMLSALACLIISSLIG